jgi:glyoxylase-like metal-dependent hydrolase (beta-lactamase superfamily II)
VENVALVWSNAAAEVHRFVVGPVDNNVYVVRCRRTGVAALIDAANEHERLLEVVTTLGVASVLETHGHWDHIGAVEHVREAGIDVWVRAEDADMLPGYDHLLEDDDVHAVGDLRLRTIHTPGHTPGSICFSLVGTPVLFSGDTLFPGGPGATSFEGGDFPTIITSIEERLFRPYDGDTIVWPGHGAATTLGVERPHVDEWVARGW